MAGGKGITPQRGARGPAFARPRAGQGSRDRQLDITDSLAREEKTRRLKRMFADLSMQVSVTPIPSCHF